MFLVGGRTLCNISNNTGAACKTLMAGLFCLALLLTPTRSQAQSAFILSGFGGGGKTLYAYSGAILPLADRLDQTGPIARFWAKTYKFSYTASLTPTTSTRIDATGWGLTGEAGYQWADDKLRIAGFAGLDYRHHNLSPNDPGSNLKNKLGLFLSLDGTIPLSNTFGFDANANTSLAYNEVWLQARPYYQMSSGTKIGPDIAYISGPDFAFTHLGLYGSGYKFTQKWLGTFYLGAEAGLQYDHDRGKYDPYGGTHLSFHF